MKSAIFAVGIFVLPVLSVAAGFQAQAEKPPTAQPAAISQNRGVVLDVVVTDKKNRIVSDLKEEDFTVFEDNVPQKVTSFAARSSAPVRAGGTQQTAGAKPASMIFLLEFTTTEPENQKRVYEAAARFVEKSLGPDDYVAVFYLGTDFRLLQEFTNDKNRLLAVLGRRDTGGLSRTQTATSSQPARTTAEATTIQAVNRSLAATGAAAGNAQAMTEASAGRVIAGVSTMGSAINQRTTRDILTVLEGISRAVEPLEGRKTLVLFSQGFVVGPQQEPEVQRAINTVNKANVAVYTVDASGLSGSSDYPTRLDVFSAESGASRIEASGGESVFDKARTAGGETRESSLRYLAVSTGGLPFRNMNDLTVSLNRVLQDMRSYYVLGYIPANQNPDGKFRTIRVELKKPGLLARTRSGYMATSSPARLEPLSAEENQLLTAARSSASTLPFDVSLAQFPAGAQRFRVPVTFEIPSRAIQFNQAGEKHAASLLIVGLIRDQEGNIVTRVGAPVNMSATTEEYKVLEKGSVSFTNTIELPPGQYSFEAFVRDQNSAKGSVRDYSLQLASPGNKLTASSIILASQADPLREGEQEAELILGKAKVLPSARRQFKNGENLIYLLNVYNVDEGGQKKPNVEVRAAIEKPGASPVKLPAYRVEQLDTVPVAHVTVGRYVSLNGLSAGRYFLVAEVEDLNSKQTCRARTSFEIVP